MFYEGNKRKQVPSNADPEKLESFFNCAATLMTENLQMLTLDSLSDFTDLISQPEVSVFSTCPYKYQVKDLHSAHYKTFKKLIHVYV